MPNNYKTMKINEIKSEIFEITQKYKWDYKEEQKLERLLKNFGTQEFESGLVIKDTVIINRLEALVKDRVWKLIFNHDTVDGFFAEVQTGYHYCDISVADLSRETKRETLRDAMLAAIQFLER